MEQRIGRTAALYHLIELLGSEDACSPHARGFSSLSALVYSEAEPARDLGLPRNEHVTHNATECSAQSMVQIEARIKSPAGGSMLQFELLRIAKNSAQDIK
jgi:hypothetical protein